MCLNKRFYVVNKQRAFRDVHCTEGANKMFISLNACGERSFCFTFEGRAEASDSYFTNAFFVFTASTATSGKTLSPHTCVPASNV